ncbi:MAG TPA: PIG-L family deacetylase [Euzebya sp.]|nr:PIG-L family deacetylase [Euzebya sp.]
MTRLLAPARRRLFAAGRAGLRGLPPGARELALALATHSRDGPTLLPGPPPGPVLVVAPHPDDEAIGPGATLARHALAGDRVVVLVITSGGATAGGGVAVTTVREEESRRALRHLGLPDPPIFGRLPDGGLADRIPEVTALINRHGSGVATVYVPSLLDPHPDHHAAARAVAHADLPADTLVMGYEVWSAGPVSALVDVTAAFAAKQAALAEYHVALQTVDYVRSASGLAAYRSATGMLGGRGFAEGFIALPLAQYRTLV